MKNKSILKIIFILLLTSLALVSCTEEEYSSTKLYKSLTSYVQSGDTAVLKNKKYNRIALSGQSVLEINKAEIYNADFDEAASVEDASTLSILNSEIISKSVALRGNGNKTTVNAISSKITSYGKYVLDIKDNAIFTGSSLDINNLSDDGAGIIVSSKASFILNNSNVEAKGVGIESDSLVCIMDTEMNVRSLIFYEGASVTLDDSRFYTEHGILLVDNPKDNMIHVSLNLEKVKLAASNGAALSLVDSKATIKIAASTIGQSFTNVIALKKSEGTVTVCNTYITGDIAADEESCLNILLKEGSVLTGAINNINKAKTVTIQIDETSSWILQADSYVRGIISKDKSLNSIKSNGFTIYYDSSCNTNSWLNKSIVNLPGGGLLVPAK